MRKQWSRVEIYKIEAHGMYEACEKWTRYSELSYDSSWRFIHFFFLFLFFCAEHKGETQRPFEEKRGLSRDPSLDEAHAGTVTGFPNTT